MYVFTFSQSRLVSSSSFAASAVVRYDGTNLHTISDKSLTYEGGLDSLSAEASLVASVCVLLRYV